MFKVQLPGSTKRKSILLALLILIALSIFIFEANSNKKVSIPSSSEKNEVIKPK